MIELQRWMASALLPALAACGSGSDSDSAAPTPLQAPQDQVLALEAQGAIPILDRSSGLAGPDGNGNGIRDDIDLYLASQPLDTARKKAAEQFARAIQGALLADLRDADALRDASVEISRAGQCLDFRGVEARHRLITAVESLTANTRERAAQYIRFNGALSGSASQLLSGDTCDE